METLEQRQYEPTRCADGVAVEAEACDRMRPRPVKLARAIGSPIATHLTYAVSG